MSLNLEIILLAAGCSSRLGQPKQLVKLQGQSLLARQARLALGLSNNGSNVSCVLGFEAQAMKRQLDDLPVKCLENEHWQSGLASSISVGVKSVSVKADAVMLLLVDQWQLTVNDLQQVMNCWQQNPDAIVCVQQATPASAPFGPPVIFPRRYFSALADLTQGKGAKSVIVKNFQQTIFVTVANAFSDLDTPEQLAQLRDFEHNN